MLFQVYKDTMLQGGEIKGRHTARPQVVICTDRSVATIKKS